LAGGTVVNTLAIAEAKAAEADPILAVIAEHHAIMAEWTDALRAEHEADDASEAEAANDAADDACHRERAHLLKVLTVQPTTLAGVVALLEHVGQDEFLGTSSGGDETLGKTVLTGLNTDHDDPRKRIVQDFPLRLAATMRALIGGAQS
jgi:hypothetical protein